MSGPATTVFDYPTPAALTAYLLTELAPQSADTDSAANAAAGAAVGSGTDVITQVASGQPIQLNPFAPIAGAVSSSERAQLARSPFSAT